MRASDIEDILRGIYARW